MLIIIVNTLIMNTKLLQIQQLNAKMAVYTKLQRTIMPQIGWIKTIRTTLGMSLQQLGEKLGVTKQNVQNIEKREREGSITIKALRETAKALDMQLVYGFVPVDASLNDLIDRKARELATQIVMRTSNSMKLEDQENTKRRINRAIEERVIEIKNEIPKALWD